MVQSQYNSPSPRGAVKRALPRSVGSPSRQLHIELERALQQLQIHDAECRKVHAFERRSFHEELNAADLASAKAHMAALEAAQSRHEAVRHEAEAVLHRHLKEQEEEIRRKEEQERQRLEQEARDKAEQERRAREIAERKAREEQARQEAEEARARQLAEEKARAAAEETARKEREATAERQKADQARADKERAGKEAADKAQAEKTAAVEREAARQKQQNATNASKIVATSTGYFASPQAESRYTEYLELHQKLKQFRRDFWEQAKGNKPLKTAIGDMRRTIKTSVGQLTTEDKVNNKKATDRVKTTFKSALETVPSPMVPVNQYLPPHLQVADGQLQLPSLVIYLLSIFSKAIISAFTGECAVNPRAAEALGTLAAQIFSLPELQFPRPNHQPDFGSMIPILMAKFHKVAPMLFGVSGPDNTQAGRARLGWRKDIMRDEKTGKEAKVFVPDQQHYDRLTGLGVGYASVALRNFSKARLRNPLPPVHYWQSLAYIVNTPPNLVTTSHLIILKSMLDCNAPERFVLFYGNVGVAALREALIDFPQRLPEALRKGPAGRSLELLVDVWGREKHFHLN